MRWLVHMATTALLMAGCSDSFRARSDLGTDGPGADAGSRDGRPADRAPPPDSAASPWACPGGPLAETADSTQSSGFYASVAATGASDDPVVYILHHNFASGDALLAVGQGGTWTSETVLAGRVLGHGTMLAAGPGGTLHALLHDAKSASLLHAVRSSAGAWTVEPKSITGAKVGVGGAALAVGSDSSLHVVSYTEGFKAAVYHGRKAQAPTWSAAVTVEPKPRSGGFFPGPNPGLAVSAGGVVHVALCTGENAIKHYQGSGATFTATQIAAKVGDQCTSSLALDGGGGVHVSYRDARTARIMYAGRLPGKSSFEAPVQLYQGSLAAALGQSNHIAVDRNADHVWVGFDSTFMLAMSAQLAHRAKGSWQSVSTADSGGRFISLSVAPGGALHVAHHAQGASVLRHVRICP